METNKQEPFENQPVWHFTSAAHELTSQTKPLIREHVLTLLVNGEVWLTFICSPTDLEALVLGFLWNENLITSMQDVEGISLSTDLTRLEINLAHAVTKPTHFHRTSTGLSPDYPAADLRPSSDYRIQGDAILALYQSFIRQQQLHNQVGGFHSAGLSDGEAIPLMAEDLGRHNCVDKLTGLYLLSQSKPAVRLLLLSGRISSEMVHKSLALGVPLIVSRTTPTALAVKIAAQAGITLIGYLRAEGFEVYCHPERVLADNSTRS